MNRPTADLLAAAKCALEGNTAGLAEAIATLEAAHSRTALEDNEFRRAAMKVYAMGSSDDIEVDDDAMISRGEDGAFVEAWVYVRNADAGFLSADDC